MKALLELGARVHVRNDDAKELQFLLAAGGWDANVLDVSLERS